MECVDTKKGDSNDNLCNSTQSSDHLSNFVNNEETTEKMSTSNESLQIKDEEKSVSDTAANGEKIDFKVIYNKQKINVEFPLDNTVAKLKKHLENIISVPEAMQKIMFKGLAKDDQTLRDLGVTKGAKVMIVGSKLDDILSVRYVSQPTKQEAEEAASTTSKEPLSKQKVHRKVLDKGMPEDVMPGILNSKDPLPDCPLAGMLNKSGGKVRLTFKLEQDQVWIGSKERTDKITMNSIKSVYSEPIHDHPEYHVMAIQLGTTEASRYWIYWVPAQYVSAIKEAVLG